MNHGVFLISKSLLLDVMRMKIVQKYLQNYKIKLFLMVKDGKMQKVKHITQLLLVVITQF